MSRRGIHIAIIMALSTATMLSGCGKRPSGGEPSSNLLTASTTPVSYEAVAELGRKWEASPGDVSKGLAYANGLASIGQTQQQLNVYARLAQLNPDNGRIAGLYGRKLVSAGRAQEAVPVLNAAIAKGESDWRVGSALGTAYDQQGLYGKARDAYQGVLNADPRNLSVLNNLGMSYALEGNLKQAEATLRQANSLPGSGAEPRIRQNLALVVGLQGRFDEASSLARQDLPPDQVEANMAYLNKMLSQPNTWQQISEGG